MRFFQRAIDAYSQGLQSYPSSLDLAYNKLVTPRESMDQKKTNGTPRARVLLEITTHPILVQELQQPLLETLQAALEAHRHALKLDPDNADTLFNTSQVLTTIAEDVAEDEDIPEAEVLKLLEEALEMQTKCLSIQELKYEESLQHRRLAEEQADAPLPADAPAQASAPAGSSSAAEEDQWFTVVEPVTADTLIDTVLAQLGTLTTLCGVVSSSPESAPSTALQWAENHSTTLLSKLQILSQASPEKVQEMALTKANFSSALLEAGYRSGKLEAATYKSERDAVFAVPELQLASSLEGLMSNARSLMTFNSTLADVQFTDPQSFSTIRWNALTEAIKHLKAASEIAGIDQGEKATTHMLRGECSLFLHNLQYPPASYPSAINNAGQLLKNATVFFRNAKALANEAEQRKVASLRETVAEYLSAGRPQDSGKLVMASPGGPEWATEQLEDMASEGLLPPDFE